MAKQYKNERQPYHTEKTRQFKKEHKESGLCVYCNRKAMDGKTMCKEHLEYHRYYKKFRTKKKVK
jgi:hypothetical protein